MARTWWGSRKSPTPRMVVEIAAIKKLFNTKVPTLVRPSVNWDSDFYIHTKELKLVTDSDNPYWLVTFWMREAQGTKRKSEVYQIRIIYRSMFPASEPHVTLPSHPRVVGNAPHTYGGGVMCLSAHDGYRSSNWDPARSTAATVGLWAVQWIRAYLRWKSSGGWPSTGG